MTATYRFGRFELNPATREILVDNQPAQLGARAFDVLLALIERRDRLVTKDELLDLVWPGLVVEENNLSVQISTLRKVLGPDAIATVAGRGYRFALEPTHTVDPAPPPPQKRKHNLPAQVASFIGRERQLAELRRLLTRNRLVTLVGVGGIGKTRLSLQLAATVREDYPDGVWFLELAPVSDLGLVPQTAASVLGIKEESGKSISRTLTEHLKGQRLMLLLDNCEHLLDGCAKLVDRLMRQCPLVTILATSRQALGVDGEQTYRVPSLSLPDPQQAPTQMSVAQFEAVRLFIDRALLARVDFEVTDQDASTVASICSRLDGIPLAIELAAARVRSLAVEEIDGKLDQRFRLLTGGSRTALPRHQTLRALIDWSYDLLKVPEQRLLQRLSVFAGGWTLEAAEQVCANDEVAAAEVLDRLTLLCDQSLVVVDQTNGHTHYRLLETLRQYARDRLLESGGGEAVRKRHRDYYLALAEEAEPKLKGAEQTAWLQRLEEEHENLRAGLAWSLAEAETGGGLRLCGALQRFWLMRGHLSEGRQWCTRVLCKAGAEDRTRERANVLNAAGLLANYQADYPAARALLEESLAIRRELGDRLGIAGSLHSLGTVDCDQGDYPAGRVLLEESLAIRRELGDRLGIAGSLNNLGNVALYQGDCPAARALYEESLAIRRELGDRFGIAMSLGNLGNVALDRGDYPAARALHEESLAIRRELGIRVGIAGSLTSLGSVALYQGDYPAARALHEESLAIRRELGERWGISYSLEGLAAVVASLRDSLRAARIWGATERLRAEIGTPLPPNERSGYDRCVAAARIASGDDAAFDSAWQEGRALRLDEAIELALQKTELS